MQYKNRYFYYSILPCLLLLITIGVYVSGYNPPTQNPPYGNLPAPINAGPDSQTKAGSLTTGGNLTTEGILKLGLFATAPAGTEGALYYDTGENVIKVYSQGEWRNLVGAAKQSLACEIAVGSCPNTSIFKMSAISNAHAELSGQTNYDYYVCCSGITGLGTSCSGNYDTVLKLSGITNAHVEKDTQANYTNSVCLSVPTGSTIICNYASDCSALGPGYTCLASISGDTNAHVGNCAAYETKVCCTNAYD